jgi:hypothetical protein
MVGSSGHPGRRWSVAVESIPTRIIIDGQFRAFQRFSSSKQALETVEKGFFFAFYYYFGSQSITSTGPELVITVTDQCTPLLIYDPSNVVSSSQTMPTLVHGFVVRVDFIFGLPRICGR